MELEGQRTRILVRAARQYGYSERQRNVRDRINATAARYRSNMFRYFGADTVSPSQVEKGVPRRFYMGNANG